MTLKTRTFQDGKPVYNYHDKEGRVVMQVHYPQGRNPFILHIDPSTGLPIKDKGKRHWRYPLLHLPFIMQEREKPILFVDDEETAYTLREFDPPYCSTTYPSNQMIWRMEYNQYLQYRNVVLLVCNPDEEKRKWYQEVIYRLLTGMEAPDKWVGSGIAPAKSVRYHEFQTKTIPEYIIRNGRAEFDKLISQLKPVAEIPERPDLDGVSEAEIALKKMLRKITINDYHAYLSWLSELDYEGQRDAYIKIIARRLNIDSRAIRKDLDNFFDTPTGQYGSVGQDMVAEVLTYLYPADERPVHQFGTVGEFTEKFNSITGQQLTSKKIGRILKHLGIKTVIPSGDPRRSKVIVMQQDELDILAQRYGVERRHDPDAKFDREFSLLLTEEHKRKYGIGTS
jgi:hypothetical protein